MRTIDIWVEVKSPRCNSPGLRIAWIVELNRLGCVEVAVIQHQVRENCFVLNFFLPLFPPSSSFTPCDRDWRLEGTHITTAIVPTQWV